LSEEQVQYALTDVNHLLDVVAKQRAALEEKGRLHWVQEECAALESLQCERIASARTTFQQLLQQHPGDAGCQIGLANCSSKPRAPTRRPTPTRCAWPNTMRGRRAV